MFWIVQVPIESCFLQKRIADFLAFAGDTKNIKAKNECVFLEKNHWILSLKGLLFELLAVNYQSKRVRCIGSGCALPLNAKVSMTKNCFMFSSNSLKTTLSQTK